MKAWLKSAAAGFASGVVAGGFWCFMAGRWWASNACAEGASRESVAGYVAACKTAGGEPSVRIWTDPPTMSCTATREVKP